MFSSINYLRLPLYVEVYTVHYVLITQKQQHTHLIQYVSVVMTATNDALTFYFRFDRLTYTVFRTCVQHSLYVVWRLEDA